MSSRTAEGLRLVVRRREEAIEHLCSEVKRMGNASNYIDKLDAAIREYRAASEELRCALIAPAPASVSVPSHVR